MKKTGEKEKIKNNLRISNMVMTGRMPFRRKLSLEEYNRFIERFNWISVNDECSPILSKRVPIRNKIEKSIHGKEKQP